MTGGFCVNVIFDVLMILLILIIIESFDIIRVDFNDCYSTFFHSKRGFLCMLAMGGQVNRPMERQVY